MSDTKITASFTFQGTDCNDIEVLNPGGWFGKTWLFEIGGSAAPFFVIIEADTLSDGIDELIDSKYGHQFIIPEDDFEDYDVASDNPNCSFAGNEGHPVDLEHLDCFGDDRTGFPCTYQVEGWGAPVEPTKLPEVLEFLETRARCQEDVKGPGKFEGEQAYVPYFYNGDPDEDIYDANDVLHQRFDVTDEDRLIFPELGDTPSVWLYEREDGFVCECDPVEEVEEESFDGPTFSVIEYSSGFAVVHNPSGEEAWMSDGVDVLHDEDGNPISPGTEGFVEKWAEALNADESETLEAYFPELVEG